MTAWCPLRLFLCAKRPVERGAAHVHKIGYMLASFAFVDQLAGMVYLFPRKFHLPASMVIRSRRLQPSRSSFHTISVSPARSIFKHRERAGRFPLAPDSPLSSKMLQHRAIFGAGSAYVSGLVIHPRDFGSK
jgi:hypothetical protein